MVLAQRVAAGLSAVEPKPPGVGPMIINRVPVSTRLSVPPGSRTIVMSSPHDMVKAKRRHVIHDRLARLEHDASNDFCRPGIVSERHANPLLGNLPRSEIGIPREPAERVPVGLQELVASPVSIR